MKLREEYTTQQAYQEISNTLTGDKILLDKASQGVLAKNHKDLEIYSMILKRCLEMEKKATNEAVALKTLRPRAKILF
jgi:hypothetical protein